MKMAQTQMEINPPCGLTDEQSCEATYRAASEVRALAQALQTVIEANDLNSNKHPAWMLSDMLVEATLDLERRVGL
ncbi:hypothetical protein [Paracoccus denitrificans]|jgi:hypothetical protein|uniref:Uncharacterized protein n=1 Tax=Paracoccus denitrificans (strain Pd 1222) TaxID=318586 RepID=A1B5D6_PARDP|nr:hypothetical protein [Paracoccus denitrificans]ABL70730.1 hypothetical protein Pden_2643 [Paracoccus denitrificans PD1222]MBB4628899.1 hypothetical protein [Paracoccus denitrificans]MCU7429978.1 hypothetical protein [Paracoccus denitrificans]QAR26053.1 hypothetical protein EO213_06915 [Paracoccus denitrificans]UPV94967.1 hypothetical protein M0K93_14210 [Paracoccus denitrificans]